MFIAFIGALLPLCGCINEELSDDSSSGNTIESPRDGEKLYASLRLNIAGDSDTRAAWDSNDENGTSYFDKGLSAEKAIYTDYTSTTDSPHFIMLFDAQGNQVLDITPISLGSADETNQDYTEYLTTTLEIEADLLKNYSENDFTSMKILCIINASNDLINKIKDSKINGALSYSGVTGIILDNDNCFYLSVTDPESEVTQKYFTMSSSIVVDDNGNLIPGKNQGESLTFYKNATQAENNPYSVYVERLQAKYTLIIKDSNGKYVYLSKINTASNNAPMATAPGTKDNPSPAERLILIPSGNTAKALKYVTSYTRSTSIENRNQVNIQYAEPGDWEINVIGWGINGLEKEEYLFKKLANTNYYNNWKRWANSSSDYTYRTFWAEDPNYSSGTYPDQYRPYPESSKDFSRSMNKSATLNYYNFYDLSQRELRVYPYENTFNADILDSKKYSSQSFMRAGSHLVLTAQLLIKGFDDDYLLNNMFFDENGLAIDNGNNPAKSKLLMNDIFWTEDAYKEYVVEYLGYLMLTDENRKIFGDTDGNFYLDDNGNHAHGVNFEIASIDIKGGDAYVYVKPSRGVKLFVKKGHQYTEVTDKYEAFVKAYPELMAANYSNGMMYYAKGSYHNRSVESVEDITTGDFGTVRNAWYAFTVEAIYKPGNPVDNANQEIIPNNEPEGESIGMTLHILDWHKIYTSVDVSGQNSRPGGTYGGGS